MNYQYPNQPAWYRKFNTCPPFFPAISLLFMVVVEDMWPVVAEDMLYVVAEDMWCWI